MKHGVMCPALEINDARLLISVLENERILGEYTPDDLMRLADIKYGISVRVEAAEARNREAAERGELV